MSTMEQWLDQVRAELDLDLEIDTDGLLDLTKEVAHSVARPAAPLTAFLVGYAAAQSGGGPDAVQRAKTQVLDLLAARDGASSD